MHLYDALSNSVDDWRKENYAHDHYDIISEVLEWARSPEGEGFRLRPPQIRALETYEGELGKKLVKIIPFNHPLSPVDLEEIKKELDARPEDERDVVVVSLGKELAVDGWLEDWNRYRKNRNVPNKIEVIELRTDERYGKFFEHKPARARVEIKREDEKATIRILDFISPTILERLEQQAGVLTPQIEDWRSMVDSIVIDTAYNGKVFNVIYSDVPEHKSDLVAGEYELEVSKKKTTVAVKITDMLGEEVLETRQI
jgi:hypothetical protein